MKIYCAGFLFSRSKSRVVLIRKVRPEWQAGKLNAVGGHIEEGETPLEAMEREFKEETGLSIKTWQEFCVLDGDSWRVHFFVAFNDTLRDVRSMTDEAVDAYWVHELNYLADTIPNLRWLVPMAAEMKKDNVVVYHIREAGDGKASA